MKENICACFFLCFQESPSIVATVKYDAASHHRFDPCLHKEQNISKAYLRKCGILFRCGKTRQRESYVFSTMSSFRNWKKYDIFEARFISSATLCNPIPEIGRTAPANRPSKKWTGDKLVEELCRVNSLQSVRFLPTEKLLEANLGVSSYRGSMLQPDQFQINLPYQCAALATLAVLTRRVRPPNRISFLCNSRQKHFRLIYTLWSFKWCDRSVFHTFPSFWMHQLLLPESQDMQSSLLTYLLTYYIATPPDRGWQRNEAYCYSSASYPQMF